MKDKLDKIIKESENAKDARAKIMFLSCFNLLEDNSHYTSGEIRKAIYDALDMLDVKE